MRSIRVSHNSAYTGTRLASNENRASTANSLLEDWRDEIQPIWYHLELGGVVIANQ